MTSLTYGKEFAAPITASFGGSSSNDGSAEDATRERKTLAPEKMEETAVTTDGVGNGVTTGAPQQEAEGVSAVGNAIVLLRQNKAPAVGNAADILRRTRKTRSSTLAGKEGAKKGVAAATATTVSAATRAPVIIPVNAMEEVHWHQDEAARLFAATCDE